MRKIKCHFGSCKQHDHIRRDLPCPFPGCSIPPDIQPGTDLIAISPEGLEIPLKLVCWQSPSRGKIYDWYELNQKDPHHFMEIGVLDKEAYLARQPETDNPIVVYHYTGPNGLKGIVENRELWFTDTRFLNDQEEIHFGFQQFKSTLNKFQKDFQSHEDLRRLFSELQQPRKLLHPAYLACFSNFGDNLALWRTYAADGNGYALGFSRRTFVAGDLSRIERGTCIYEKSKQVKVFQHLIQSYLSLYSLFKDHSNASLIPKVEGRRFLSDIFQSIILTKHPGFESEAEFRMLLTSSQKPKVRVGKNYLIPYITSDQFCIQPYPEKGKEFSRFELFDPNVYFLEKVVIGPSHFADRMEQGLRTLLDINGFNTTTIEHSQTPYRAQ